MGLNNIQLPLQTVVDLYKNQLCEDEAPNPSPKPAPAEKKNPVKDDYQAPTPINFLGKNLAQFIILVNYSDEVYLPETELNFIGNILKACKMNLADVAIVNISKQDITMEAVSTQLNPKYLVIFGIDSSTIKLSQPPAFFNVTTTNGTEIFTAPALEKLNQDTEEGKLLKSKLWLCMKKMLNL